MGSGMSLNFDPWVGSMDPIRYSGMGLVEVDLIKPDPIASLIKCMPPSSIARTFLGCTDSDPLALLADSVVSDICRHIETDEFFCIC